MSQPARPPRLLHELRENRRDLLKTAGPAVLLATVGFLVAFYFVEPPPPRELVIAAGQPDGNYFRTAERYARLFQKHGITLTVRETAGSVENYELLLNDDSVDLAIVQGGAAPQDPGIKQLESIATLYLEPVWVFVPRGRPIRRLTDLRGLRIAVGKPRSGTRMLAEALLDANGVREGEAETAFVSEDAQRSIDLLHAGEVDALFLVLSADSPMVRTLLADERVEVLNFDRSQAYSRRFPYLESVVLAQGVVDLAKDLPATDVNLIAPAANLVATHELHDALIPLLIAAATESHESGSLVTAAGDQPSLDGAEFPPNPVARQQLKYGPSFFQKYLGFWVASLIDRAKILVLPLLILLVPLIKMAPSVYRWRIRSRIYRWYALLRGIDQALRDGRDDAQELRATLVDIAHELEDVTVPLSYMEEFYNLRLHIDLVMRQLDERLTEPGD